MRRRAFLRNTGLTLGGLAGVSVMGRGTAAESKAESAAAGVKIGRPVRVTSISFANGLPLAQIAAQVDGAGAAGADVIALPEQCRGMNDASEEGLDGPTVRAMAELAGKHHTYVVCPIDRKNKDLRLNTVVLLDRNGKIACTYDKIFPYWSEYNVHPPVHVGDAAQIYDADFGRLGFATCFDVNFPEVWRGLADKGAELVIWPSAYSAGTSLQAHALNHHFYIVSSTQTRDCLVYDITGEKLLYQKSETINVANVTLDLDRGIYHENFNLKKRDQLLAERAGDLEMEQWLKLEQWFVLKAKRPGVSARQVARQFGLEELRDYLDRSRRSIDGFRGWPYEAKVLFPTMDVGELKALRGGAKPASSKG